MLFLDIETQKWDEFMRLQDLKISYVGVIDESGREYDFWEEDLDKLGEMLRSADWVVGYNSVGFDMPVIANYLGEDINNIPQIDLMLALYKTVGFRPKLDDVANATLGFGKNGKGSDAPLLWVKGELQKLRDYCIQDVKVTKALYDFGVSNGYVKYYDKSGFLQTVDINWDLGKKLPAPKDESISLF